MPGRGASPVRAARSLCHLLSPFLDENESLTRDAGHWAEVFDLAGRYRLETALAAELSEEGDPPSTSVPLAAHATLFLRGALQRNRERNARFRAQATEAVTALNAAGMTPVLLKGVHDLLERPPEETDRRWMADLDLLVPREHRTEAAEALTAIGYQPYVEAHDDHYGHHLPALHRAGEPGSIEVHWEVAADLGKQLLPASEILAGALPQEAEGLRYLRMPDPQRLIYLILHAQIADRHHYRFELPLRALNDFSQLAYRASAIDWPAMLQHFRSRGAEVECGTFFTLAHRLFGWPWPFEAAPDTTWNRHARRTLGLLRLPSGVARSITLGDELRKGFSLPVLRRVYPDLEPESPWTLRRHHLGALLRKHRGRYWARLSSGPLK